MYPKKSLGQNFLRDEKILTQIISVADLKLDDNVIEIGPGEGSLTEKLSKQVGRIIAIEKDDSLAEKAKTHFCENKKIEIINQDILEINLSELIEKNNFQKYKVVANIPYYITSPIIRLFLEAKYPPIEMILTVQREVAERVCASPGQMSILAVAIQYYAKAELLFHVDKKSFWPVPKVDSAVISIRHNMKSTTKEQNKNFFRIVRAGFSAKRKTIINNLSSSFHLDKKEIEKIIKKVGLRPTQRAQEFSISNWKKLSREIKEKLPKSK